jgi:UDP-2,3-diacylglucosamine pyrophosphatase LpxH
VKNAVSFIGHFEETLAKEAKRLGCDGVICGHIHHATLRDLEGVTYINSGDWVESCTAIIEHFDGRFEIVRWSDQVREKNKAIEPSTESKSGSLIPQQAA